MKKLLAFALVLCMALSLCACGGSTGSPAAPAESAAPAVEESAAPADTSMYDVTEPITIVWWHALEDQYAELVNEVVEGFNASQDPIAVQIFMLVGRVAVMIVILPG